MYSWKYIFGSLAMTDIPITAVTWAPTRRPVTISHRRPIPTVAPLVEVAEEVAAAAEEEAAWAEVTILAARRIMWTAQPSTHDRRPSSRCRTAIWSRPSFPPVFNTFLFFSIFTFAFTNSQNIVDLLDTLIISLQKPINELCKFTGRFS